MNAEEQYAKIIRDAEAKAAASHRGKITRHNRDKNSTKPAVRSIPGSQGLSSTVPSKRPLKRKFPEEDVISKDLTIIWVPVDPPTVRIDERENSVINLRPGSDSNTSPWLFTDTIASLQKSVGTQFASCHPTKKQRHIHQNLVTLEILRQKHGYPVRYAKNIDEAINIARSLDDPEKSMVLLLHTEEVDWVMHMQIYNRLSQYVGSIHPTHDEFNHEEFKIHDIDALDKVASESGTWRPKTCLFERGKCPLGDVMSVTKRSHSSGAVGVRIWNAPGKKGKAMCKQKQKVRDESDEHAEVDELENAGYYQWIHQEYVPSLMDWGELRVFIATRPGRNGDREPFVFHIIRTNPTCSTGEEEGEQQPKPKKRKKNRGDDVATPATPIESADDVHLQIRRIAPGQPLPDCKRFRYEDVERYALDIYRSLTAMNSKGLESLKVGVRLDIGISPSGDSFWVNEITRWYAAHYFPMKSLEEPYDKICQVYAQAFSEVVESQRKTETNGYAEKRNINRSEGNARKRTKIKRELDRGTIVRPVEEGEPRSKPRTRESGTVRNASANPDPKRTTSAANKVRKASVVIPQRRTTATKRKRNYLLEELASDLLV